MRCTFRLPNSTGCTKQEEFIGDTGSTLNYSEIIEKPNKIDEIIYLNFLQFAKMIIKENNNKICLIENIFETYEYYEDYSFDEIFNYDYFCHRQSYDKNFKFRLINSTITNKDYILYISKEEDRKYFDIYIKEHNNIPKKYKNNISVNP